MPQLERPRAPLPAVAVVQRRFAARAEEVTLRDLDVVERAAAFVGEVDLRIGGEVVLRGHGDIDDAVVRREGGDGHGLEEVEGAERALALAQPRRIVRFAFMKEEELADERRARRDGQTVGDPVERALPRLRGAEERDGRDGDPSDAQAGCEEQQEDERRHRRTPLASLTPDRVARGFDVEKGRRPARRRSRKTPHPGSSALNASELIHSTQDCALQIRPSPAGRGWRRSALRVASLPRVRPPTLQSGGWRGRIQRMWSALVVGTAERA